MTTKSIRMGIIFLANACLLYAYSQIIVLAKALPDQAVVFKSQGMAVASAAGPAAPSGILYNQPINSSGVLLQSSQNGSDKDVYVWDRFTIPSTQTVTEVDWKGGYAAGGQALDFAVSIYASLAGGSQPDLTIAPLAHYLVGGNAGETPAGTVGGTAIYNYSFTLPVVFTAAGGTNYWLQIEAAQAVTPDWGWAAGTGGEGKHFRQTTNGVDFFYQIVSGDAAFSLLGPSSEVLITGLGAVNDSPMPLGGATHLTASVSAGNPVTYSWNFGDGGLGVGRTVTHAYGTAGFYAAIVTASNSLNSLTATTRVTITSVPISGLSAVNDSPTPLGGVTHLTATVSAGNPVTYSWNFGDGHLGSGASLTHTYETPGSFPAIVTATNESSSPVTATTLVTITAADVPISGLIASNDSPTLIQHATSFTATVVTGSSITYQWNFGDGITSTAAITPAGVHLYTKWGAFTATLTAWNTANLITATTSVLINPYRLNLPIILK